MREHLHLGFLQRRAALTTMDSAGRVIEVDHYDAGNGLPAPWGTNPTNTKTGTARYAYDQVLSGCTGPATKATDEAGNTKYTSLYV